MVIDEPNTPARRMYSGRVNFSTVTSRFYPLEDLLGCFVSTHTVPAFSTHHNDFFVFVVVILGYTVFRSHSHAVNW